MMYLKFFVFVLAFCFTAVSFADNQPQNEKQIEKAEKREFKPSPEMLAAMKDPKVASVDNLTQSERVIKYLRSGFIHIIPEGIDHILFILGLFFSTVLFSKLVWQVTMFTLAHTITLALATLGIVQVSAAIVEPLIALSIAYIAFENIKNHETGKGRLAIIFIFGLLHGLGFAYVLAEYGLSTQSLATSLIAFNVGVEIGQLTVLALAWVLLYRASKWPSYRAFIQVPASLVIGAVGLFWTIERLI